MCRRPFEVGRLAISGRSPGWRGGERWARRPALRGAWPGRPARPAPGPPPQRVAGGPAERLLQVAAAAGAERGQIPSGGRVAGVVMDVSRGVSVRGSAFGRWDERVAAPPACPPPPPPPLPPLSPLPSSPPPFPAAGPRLGAPSAGPGSVCAQERPEPGAPASPASLLPARAPRPRPPRPLLPRGRDSARRHFWTRLLLSVPFLRASLRAAAPGTDPGSGCRERLPGLLPRAPRPARRGSGSVRLDLGRGGGGAGRWGSAEMRARPRAAFVFQVTGPPHLPSAPAARRYRRPRHSAGGAAQPGGLGPLVRARAPSPPARPCPP